MELVPARTGGFDSGRAMLRAMGRTLVGYWHAAAPYQKATYLAGAGLVASGFFHVGVLVVDGGSLQGDVSWRKPIVFGFSFGITVATLAWVLTFLTRVGRLTGWLLFAGIGLASMAEVGLITMQQWRGVPSHFNVATPFDAMVFNLMGLLVLLIMLSVVAIWVLTFFSLKAPPSLGLALRMGMLLLVASQFFGVAMILNDSNTFGAAGSMKVPHGLSTHAVQVLPGMAWLLLFTPTEAAYRVRVVLAGGVGYVLLVTAAAYQTFSGEAPLAVEGVSLAGHVAGVGLLAAAAGLVLAALVRATRNR